MVREGKGMNGHWTQTADLGPPHEMWLSQLLLAAYVPPVTSRLYSTHK